jgi:hypothetical protein
MQNDLMQHVAAILFAVVCFFAARFYANRPEGEPTGVDLEGDPAE